MTSPDWARPVVYFSIASPEPERQRAFYSALFNWDIGEGRIMQIPTGIGGPENGIGGHINGAATPHIALYIQIRDLDEALERAVSLGGTKEHDPFQIPGGARIAGITDPDGNHLVLVQQ